MQLELVSLPWLQQQPAYLEFSKHHRGQHKTRVAEFVSMLAAVELIALVDEAGRPFVDVKSPLWVRLTTKAQARGFNPAPARGNGTQIPTYQAMHQRVKKVRGAASQFKCDHCHRKAAHWAYDNADRDERRQFSEEGWGPDSPYSLHVEHYVPMCAAHHKAYDDEADRSRKADQPIRKPKTKAERQAKYRQRVKANNRVVRSGP